MLQMVVEGLTIDRLTNTPVVILKDIHAKRSLLIWIGSFEASAIAREMEQVITPRPMTHELIKNILNGFHITISRVVINDLKNDTFYAQIFLLIDGEEVAVDSRPSDAIVLALQVKAPVFVAMEVLDKAETIDLSREQTAHGVEEVEEWLKNIKPEDFDKYRE